MHEVPPHARQPEVVCDSPLHTDLYELTMAAAYHEAGFQATGSFELTIRALPPQRNFLLAAGLEQALEFLESMRFRRQEIDFLRRHPVFANVKPEFFHYLEDFRFRGEVWAVPEGTPVFGEEPLVRVKALIIEAQVVETYLLSMITFQSMIASKAARVAEAAQGRGVVEFGTRRAHGPESGVLAARAAYIGGCIGTSNVEAALRFGVPAFGTLAHSYIMAHRSEEESFREFHRVCPNKSILLLDTYDTLEAVDKIIRMGLRPAGVRLDSGDLGELSKQVRRRLDAAGMREVKIFASGDLEEHAITELLARGAAIDSFGVGTELATSKDAPALGGVYKLVEVDTGGERRARAKFSPGKPSYPGAKQVFRFRNAAGFYDHDLIGRSEEKHPEAEPLLECVMQGGRRLAPSPPLAEVRERAQRCLAELPGHYRQLRDAPPYPVRRSKPLQALMEEIAAQNSRKEHAHR